jgi:hypothetical protein
MNKGPASTGTRPAEYRRLSVTNAWVPSVGSAAPQACDFARRGAAGGRVGCFARRLGARLFPDFVAAAADGAL